MSATRPGETELRAQIQADIRALAEDIIAVYPQSAAMIATAESCTGGLIAGAITDVAGSSAVFDRGFVTYSNQAKQDMLGVREATWRPSAPCRRKWRPKWCWVRAGVRAGISRSR
jgi:hypothetical protein